jgi:hypothetical protein
MLQNIMLHKRMSNRRARVSLVLKARIHKIRFYAQRSHFQKNNLKKYTFTLMCANDKHICNMSFCSPCQAQIDADPTAVLLRRDEFGNNMLCNECRRAIQKNNVDAQNGLHNFTYERPDKKLMTTQPTICPQTFASPTQTVASLGSQSQRPSAFDFSAEPWFCKRCHSRVWAHPRAFEGENEPEEWWWCNTCKQEKLKKIQKEKTEREQARRKAQQLQRQREASKASKALRSPHELSCYPKLDKWLRRQHGT